MVPSSSNDRTNLESETMDCAAVNLSPLGLLFLSP